MRSVPLPHVLVFGWIRPLSARRVLRTPIYGPILSDLISPFPFVR
jgi:hypothetical protein